MDSDLLFLCVYAVSGICGKGIIILSEIRYE